MTTRSPSSGAFLPRCRFHSWVAVSFRRLANSGGRWVARERLVRGGLTLLEQGLGKRRRDRVEGDGSSIILPPDDSPPGDISSARPVDARQASLVVGHLPSSFSTTPWPDPMPLCECGDAAVRGAQPHIVGDHAVPYLACGSWVGKWISRELMHARASGVNRPTQPAPRL